MKLAFLAISIVLLLWQLWRSRLTWYWRWLWVPVVANVVLMALPPSSLQPLSSLVVVTPGDANSEQQALQWAHQHDAKVLRLPTVPTTAELKQLQQNPQQPLQLFGYGVSAAAWQQMPPRVVNWTAPVAPDWQLSSASQVTLGDVLNIHLQAPHDAHVVQLRDARREVVADAPVLSGVATLIWQPTVVGHFDWLLQVRDKNEVLLRELPLAFAVVPVKVQRVLGNFSAPSFEQRALREWLQQTGMQGEFVTQTGQQLQRRDEFNTSHSALPVVPASVSSEGDVKQKDILLLRDLRSWYQGSAAERSQQLQQVADGATLVLLADGSEAEQSVRSAVAKQLAAEWQLLNESEQAFAVGETTLQRAAWQLQRNRYWQQLEGDVANPDATHDMVLTRVWQHGRILWVGVSDSHRLWQRARVQYARWWQQTLALPDHNGLAWQPPESGIQREPTLLCVDNFLSAPTTQNQAAPTLILQTPDGVLETLPLQTSSRPGQGCVLYTPASAGWYQITGPVVAWWRVFEQAPLPEQRQRAAYDATRQHSQMVAATVVMSPQPLSRWPFALVFLICLAAIWWRERQLPPR